MIEESQPLAAVARPGRLSTVPSDMIAGFLVMLIALPLCLGIAAACGFPPIAGIFTAIVGGIVPTMLSNSELTIKGPAAGLIVVAIGCIQDFGGDGLIGGWSPADQTAYRMALGVGVAAAIVQVLFGLLKAGAIGEFIPTSAVHGMLAAIGVIIIAKQLPITLGIEATGEPLQLLMSIPNELLRMNPSIALIGGVSFAILFGLPRIKQRWVQRIPAPMAVILVAVPLGMWMELDHTHTYTFGHQTYELREDFHLVDVPENMVQALAFPDFSAFLDPVLRLRAWKWTLMFALVGVLESMLSAKAIDSLDPYRRTTNLDRDNLAVGVANLAASAIGGLPMISEIVRSKANIDSGARTRSANLFHGLFLLILVAAIPWLIHRIPMAALGAMLVYTGFRLASPREFSHVYKIGREQFVVFATTIVAVLATDLLVGIGIGVSLKILIHLFNGLPLRSVFRSPISVEEPNHKTYVVRVADAAVFTNWISLQWRLRRLAEDRDVIVDLSETRLVDHTVMEKLHELGRGFKQGRRLSIVGLDDHHALSGHPYAARRKCRRSA